MKELYKENLKESYIGRTLEKISLVFEKKIIKAYKEVFGIQGNQTKSQKLVIADLMKCAGTSILDHGSNTNDILRIVGRKEMFAMIMAKAQYMKLYELEAEINRMTMMEEEENGQQYY